MNRIKIKKGFGTRPLLLTLLLLVIALGAGTAIWNHHQLGAKAEGQNSTPREGLSGTVSSLDIREWSIRLSFKDADKVKYSVAQTDGNHLELYARGIYLPADACSRLGVVLNRSNNKNPDFHNTHVGNYYYYFSGSPGYCDTNKPDDSQTANLKNSLVSNGFGPGDYTITAH